MKGDFSRGIQPDRKRGKLYRRVLLQQGRLLLDSDIAALVDAEDSLLRGLSQDTVGPSGSPDLGYFVTSGPLLAAFVPPIYLKDSVQSLSISQSSSTTFTGHLDYGIKYLDRYPSLIVDGTVGQGSEIVTFRQPFTFNYVNQVVNIGTAANPTYVTVSLTDPSFFTAIRLHLLAHSAVTLNATISNSLTGQTTVLPAIPVSASGDNVFVPHVIPIPTLTASDPGIYDTITITVPTGKRVWVGLIEAVQNAKHRPFFWVAGGKYHAHGLPVQVQLSGKFPEATQIDGRYPSVSFPSVVGFNTSSDDPAPWGASYRGVGLLPTDPALPAQFPSPPINPDFLPAGAIPGGTDLGYRMVYLEATERHLTYVDDPGIQEQALGGNLDTTTRTQALGQVKIAACNKDVDFDEAHIAFGAVPGGGGLLNITIATQQSSADPCAIPEAGGFTGPANRLYRFEVHDGTRVGDLRVKWSRNNASSVFRVLSVNPLDPSHVTLSPGADVSQGDLIEIESQITILGDSQPGSYTGPVNLGDPPAQFVPPVRMVGALYKVAEIPGEDTATGKGIYLLGADPSAADYLKNIVALDPAFQAAVDAGYDLNKVFNARITARRWDNLIDTSQYALANDPISGAVIVPHKTVPIDVEEGISITLQDTPANPFIVTVTFQQGWDGGVVTVNGTDATGAPLSENFDPSAAGGVQFTANGSTYTTFTGVDLFQTVSGATWSAPAAVSSATVSIGQQSQAVDSIHLAYSASAGKPLPQPFHSPNVPWRPNDYWQYEARTLKANDNGPWQQTPHGPERLFAPLALIQYYSDISTSTQVTVPPGQYSGEPGFEIVRYLDTRFSALSELTGFDVAYDGAGSNSTATNVQAALDDLYKQLLGGCNYSLAPSDVDNANDAPAIQAKINLLPSGGVICLRPGTFHLKQQITIPAGVKIELRGYAESQLVNEVGSLAAPAGDPLGAGDPAYALGSAAFDVQPGGRLVLTSVTVYSTAVGSGPLVNLEAPTATAAGGALEANGCKLVQVRKDGSTSFGTIIQASGTSTPADTTVFGNAKNAANAVNNYGSQTLPQPSIRLDNCTLVGGWSLVATHLSELRIRSSFLYTMTSGIYVNGNIGKLEVVGSQFFNNLNYASAYTLNGAGVSFDSFVPFWTTFPLQMLDDLSAVVEGGKYSLQNGTIPVIAGAGLFAQEVSGGVVMNSTFGADMGFWAIQALDLTFNTNRYYANDTGLRIDNAQRVSVRGDRVDANNIGIHVPAQARDCVITGCDLEGPGGVNGVSVPVTQGAVATGIGFASNNATGLSTTFTRNFLNNEITQNRIIASGNGIMLGRDGTSVTDSGTIQTTVVHDNYVTLTGAGSALWTLNSAIDHVTGNHFEGSGPVISITNGNSQQVLDNFLLGGGTSAMKGTSDATVSGNHVAGSFSFTSCNGVVVRNNRTEAGGLSFATCTLPRVIGNYLETTSGSSLTVTGSANAELFDNTCQASVSLTSSTHSIVRGNHLLLGAGLVVTSSDRTHIVSNVIDGTVANPLNVSSSDYVQVIGNRFGSGKLLIVGSTQPTFRSNRCESSGLYITTNGTAKSGIVSDNHFDYFTGSEPSGGPGGPWNWSLDVALAQGDWQIENNQASGIIRVLPVLDAGKVNELVYNAQVKGNRAVVLQVGYLAPAQINPTPVPQTNPNTATPAADSIIMVIGNNMGDIPANSPNYGFVVNIYSKAVVNLNVSTKGSANTSNMAKGINSPNLLL